MMLALLCMVSDNVISTDCVAGNPWCQWPLRVIRYVKLLFDKNHVWPLKWKLLIRFYYWFSLLNIVGILGMYEEILLNMDFIHLAQFLTRLPESMSAVRLFRHIEAISMSIDKRRFGQVLASHKEIHAQKEQDRNDTWCKEYSRVKNKRRNYIPKCQGEQCVRN